MNKCRRSSHFSQQKISSRLINKSSSSDTDIPSICPMLTLKMRPEIKSDTNYNSDDSDFEVVSTSESDIIASGYERLQDDNNQSEQNVKNFISPKNIIADNTKKLKLSLSQEQIFSSSKMNNNQLTIGTDIKKSRSASNIFPMSLSLLNGSKVLPTPSLLPLPPLTDRSRQLSRFSFPMSDRRQSNILLGLPLNENSSTRNYYIPRKVSPTPIFSASTDFNNSYVPRVTTTINPVANNIFHRSTSTSHPEVALQSYEKYLDDNFKCFFCKTSFNDPRVLDCLHTFCLQCLTELEDSGGGKTNSSQFWEKFGESEFEWHFFSQDEKFHSQSGSCIESEQIKESESRSSPFNNNKRRSRNSSTISYSDKPKTIQCPRCQYFTEFPIGGVARLPKNFIIARKIEEAILRAKQDALVTIWCSLCSTEILASAQCFSCGLNLCTFCKEAHMRQRMTSSHVIKNLSEIKKARSASTLEHHIDMKRNLKCPIHAGHDLKLFCTSCHQVACNDCIILLHRDHKCESIHRASKVYLKLIKDALEKTRPMSDGANQTISKLVRSSKKIIQTCDTVQNDVELFLVEYFQTLEVHRKTLLNQITKIKEIKMEILTNKKMDLEKRSNEAKMTVSFTEELLADGSEIEILSFVGMLLRRFEYCQKSKNPLNPKISDSLQFLPDVKAPYSKAQNNIPMYGIITTQTAIAKFCTLETDGLLNLRVYRKVELILLTKDGDERQLCHGGIMITTELKYKGATGRNVLTQVSDQRDGSYIISFIPDAPGEMILSVSIKEKPIKNSPFTLVARTLKPHGGIYHCCAFCSSDGSKTAQCSCPGRMPGGFNGCGHGHPGHPGRRHWSCCANVLENSECSTANAFQIAS